MHRAQCTLGDTLGHLGGHPTSIKALVGPPCHKPPEGRLHTGSMLTYCRYVPTVCERGAHHDLGCFPPPRRRSPRRRRRGQQPSRRVLPTELPGVAETFGDELALVTALQLRWRTRLAGHVERALSELPDDLETAVVTAWRATAGELAGVRQVLDAQRATAGPELADALEKARRKDAVLMAAMAGLASPSDPRRPGHDREARSSRRRPRGVPPDRPCRKGTSLPTRPTTPAADPARPRITPRSVGAGVFGVRPGDVTRCARG